MTTQGAVLSKGCMLILENIERAKEIMTYTTQLTGRKAVFSSRIFAMVLTGFALVMLQSSTVQAQWTSPDGNSTINVTAAPAKVGIGTTSPSGTKLHVFYNTASDVTIVAEAGSSMSPALEFKDAAATPNRWRVGSGWNSTTDGLFFIYDKRQSAARMIIDTSGNVGIGTSSPGAKLHVNAGGTNAILLGADTEVPTYNVISLNGSVTDAGHLGLAGGGGTDKTLYVDTPTGGAINFRVNTSIK